MSGPRESRSRGPDVGFSSLILSSRCKPVLGAEKGGGVAIERRLLVLFNICQESSVRE